MIEVILNSRRAETRGKIQSGRTKKGGGGDGGDGGYFNCLSPA